MTLNIGQRTSSATGGTISTIAGYTVHTFTTGGNFIPRGSGTIEVLVVGGGGNGGSGENSGGGGGGAVVYNKFVNVTSGTPYQITVGSVGTPTGGISSCTFNSATIIAYGGGAGGSPFQAGFPSPNASGGGGSSQGTYTEGVGAGITGLGFPGAPSGGGGGGAGSTAANKNGGIGVSYSITGISSYYGGGGKGAPGGSSNGGLPGQSYGTGGSAGSGYYGGPAAFPGAVIIRYPS